MTTDQLLRQTLLRLDGLGYKAYKDIQGSYEFPGFALHIDYVQGDPFAAPSRLRVVMPQSQAGFPAETWQSRSREIALRDYLTRQFGRVAAAVREKRGSGNSGLIAIAPTSQYILERSALWVTEASVEARFSVGLPARGRQILGRTAAELLCDDLPLIVGRSLLYASLNPSELQRHLEVAEDADWLRDQLARRGLVAFVPDGALLPRQSGIDDRPLKESSAVQFRSPDSLRVEFDRPNQGPIAGMGIPQGVTLIVGGGYHGKSTLLRAIALGVYNVIPGDGREHLVTDAAAVKIRAEDGRSITGVDISPFINHLPQGRSTTSFTTENASGSTSQAASIVEALEAGARVLLVDEDTSATNFMIRDRRMQALVAKEREPITPFIDKIRQLYQDYDVSTILVMGGSGDYFDVADTVIAMTDYQPQDVTEQARAIATQFATHRAAEGGDQFGSLSARVPLPKRLDSPEKRWEKSWHGGRGRGGNRPTEDDRPERSPKLKARDVDELVFGAETVDLSAVEQLVEVGQVRLIGAAIAHIQQHSLDGRRPLPELLRQIAPQLATAQIDRLTPYPQGDLVTIRPLELAAAFNRLRSLSLKEK
ncbi:MAG: ABC-ATPase domain-containing protein [Cyanobacteria bacterium J069]|nr:MAG: ATPase [Cyanobacteria bacterium J069]